ncbi:SCO family protein [Snuella lapsa]|uniref:Heavy metal binding domain-containing protein n=1 Tax=Snuella lapsa TaxID=870481 RepID=A0ABP6Y0C5_9FLAO
MRYLKFIVTLVVLTVIIACKDSTSHKAGAEKAVYKCPMQCEGNKAYTKLESCPVCKMDLAMVENQNSKITEDAISDESIFNLTTTWHTEEGNAIQLKDLRGKTLVMVMIYTTCKAACPRLVADMRNIEAKIPKDKLNDLQFVLVSIDPKNDTPTRLKAFAKENFMDGEQWTFLQGNESGVREFANVLAVKYKQISPIDFSHSNIISVFNSGGELVHQQEGLGVDNKETVDSILKLVQ